MTGEGLKQWLVIYTLPQAEWAVCQRLKPLETLWLHYKDSVRHARRTREVVRSYFPRYVFVKVLKGAIYGVSKTIGVHSIVGIDGPEEIPEAVIADLRGRGDENGLVELTPEEKQLRKRLRKGDRIKIQYGNLTGYQGTVIIDSGRIIRLEVEGKRVSALPEQLSPACAAR